jgi:hypothetical protein
MKDSNRKNASKSEIPGNLWALGIKVRGLGELFSMASGEPPLGDEAFKGISYLLTDIANEIERIRKVVET